MRKLFSERRHCHGTVLLIIAAAIIMAACMRSVKADDRGIEPKKKLMAGDFHQHTTYTDGSNPVATVMFWNNAFGLDWWANSEHGGSFTIDGFGPVLTSGFDTSKYARPWDNSSVYPAGTIIGDVSSSGGHQKMWRWQSIRDFSFNDVLHARTSYDNKIIIQGLEWNMPGHEHCSTAIITGQFGRIPAAWAMAEFEYKFDNSDTDVSGGASQGWIKSTLSGHAKAVEAAIWMQDNHPMTSWLVPAHPERRKAYHIEDFRDLNNAAPTVAFGFEGCPGHQKESDRGAYSSGADGGSTYGGCGVYIAKVGGLWDALLGEGRQWWTFTSSDFHNTRNDFWPGEYQKTWTFVNDETRDGRISAQELVNALRSGNSFTVHGDLINVLEFTAKSRNHEVEMGGELVADKPINNLKIKIKFKSPGTNNCVVGDAITSCAAPVVDHIDLIAGEITGKIDPSSSDYTDATNPSAQVIASFTSKDWEKDEEGCNVIIHHIRDVKKSMYFRLRGTNLSCNTPFETAPVTELPSADYCSPLPDALVTQNLGIDGAQEAWNDLWFYSNPLFVKIL